MSALMTVLHVSRAVTHPAVRPCQIGTSKVVKHGTRSGAARGVDGAEKATLDAEARLCEKHLLADEAYHGGELLLVESPGMNTWWAVVR